MHIMAVEEAQCGLLPVALQPELTEQGFSECAVKYHRKEIERKKEQLTLMEQQRSEQANGKSQTETDP